MCILAAMAGEGGDISRSGLSTRALGASHMLSSVSALQSPLPLLHHRHQDSSPEDFRHLLGMMYEFGIIFTQLGVI